jgi:flagellar assembly factor FliW
MTVVAEQTQQTTDLPVIELVSPMPGFPSQRRFVLVRLEETGALYALTSIDLPDLRFLVMPPGAFFPDYTPEIDDETLAALDVRDPANLMVLLVVTAGVEETTANLMAPIVLDTETRRAVQLVLGGSGLPVRQRLMAA